MTRCIQWWSNSTRRGHCLQSYKEMLALITQLKSLVLVCVVVLAIKLTRQRTICILALTPELHVTLWYFSHCKCSRSTFLQRDWSHDSPSCLRQAAGADKSNPSCYDDPVYKLFTASVAFASWKHRSHFETQEAPLMLLGRRLDMGKTDEWVAMIKWLLILQARWFWIHY